ncbi:uncharacterized protein Dark [Calliphora vicina]|uniref:uncharacterized protein Dark n=1 Tax=Calliphora vicina TaxID=7373 RepID=UPI00325BCB03
MSFHSRSSSEVEATPYSEIISVFYKDFYNDFDFSDVKDELRRSVFTDTEFDYIAKEKGVAQIFHLIWVLCNKTDSQMNKFFDVIYNDYKWIVDKIKAEANDHSEDTALYLETVKSLQREFQSHTDYNVHRTKLFLKLRSALRKLNPKSGINSVVLLGGLGSGKKWLSIDVCSDFSVLKSMNFKIYWIDCSNCTSQQEDYRALQILMLKLNPLHKFENGSIGENVLRLKEQIKLQMKAKESRNECLLVLANVQNVKCQEAFNLDCKRLIITRNKKVSDYLSPKLNIHLTLNVGFSREEFFLLLDKYILHKYDWRKDSLDLANDMYHLSHGDPYLLSIIARNIREKKSNWNEWMKNINNFSIPDLKFIRDVEKSLLILKPDQLQLYATLAVFPYCAQIPVKLLSFLWNKTEYEAEVFVEKFHINSFVQKQILEDNDTIVCCVKYVYSSYIKNCKKMQQLIKPQELHSRIIEYYKVEENLNVRKDVDLDFDSHDGYFFRWIGYHLHGANYKHLFPRLYKDFGFLGQKMRAVGLNNTIADLRNYDVEISLGDRKYSFKKLKAFLAKMEEKIIHFPDCCLLQYALLSGDFISENALQQIEQFPRRLWLSESGQYQQWRFIFSLPDSAKIVRILDQDLCIMALANNNTYLIDLSLDSRYSRLLLMEGVNINNMQIFDNKNHVLTLDYYGNLKLWDISVEKRRILNQRRNVKANFNATIACSANQIFPKQNINDYINSWSNIQTFYLEVGDDPKYTLLVSLKTGLLKFLDWNQTSKEFEQKSYQIPHKTEINKIHSISKIKTHYMIIYYTDNGNMDAKFLKLRNTEEETKKFDWPQNAKLVYHKVCNDVVVLVFNHVVVRLSLTFYPNFDGQLEVLYESPHCIINCGKLLLENKYLMLGTAKGLIIFDIAGGIETLESSVSENISSVDNYDLDDEEFKSMIVCGCSNKNIAYIFGLRLAADQTLVWEHSSAHQTENLEHLKQLKNTRFLGRTMFDVSEEDDTLYAVDSKNRIHQICRAETKNWSIIPSSLEIKDNVIGIHCFKNSVIVAYENGDIYDLQQKRLIVRTNEIVGKDFYLKTVDDNILVASSAKEKTYVKHMTTAKEMTIIDALTKYSNMVMGNYFLIVNNFGASLFFDCEKEFTLTFGIHAHSSLAACDLKDNVLFLGFYSYAVHIYNIVKNEDGSINCHKRSEIPPLKDVQITCLTASNNAKLLAIGLDTAVVNGLRSCGDIEVFKLNDDYKPQLIYCLKSHVRPINDLKFSPLNEILVSVAEQICFWNINYVLNNPLEVGSKKRHSSRFTSQKSAEEVDFKGVTCQQQRRDRFLNLEHQLFASSESTHKAGHSNNNSINNSMEQSVGSDDLNDDSVFSSSLDKPEESSWSCLTGPCDKPELLSCLKLDGNEAKKIVANKNFNQFYTIDDEGVYYNLQRIKPAIPAAADDIDMPDSSSSSINLEYLDVHRLSVASSTMSGTDVVDTANT